MASEHAISLSRMKGLINFCGQIITCGPCCYISNIYSPHYRHQRYPGVEAGKFVDADSLGSASLRTPNGRALAGVR